MEKNKLFDKFLAKALKVHGDKYDYSFVEYNHSQSKILIRCKIHDNLFEQVPANHLRGRTGCLKCNPQSMQSKEDFVIKAQTIHGDTYDYSQMIFNGMNKPFIIICKIHGEFEQLSTNHLNGNGCPKCGKLIKQDDTKKFIIKSLLTHKNKYKYDLVEYIDSKTKVKIICPEHGEFEQLPYSHIRGKGCDKCAKIKISKIFVLTLEEFISKSLLAHKNKYNYDLVEYINSQTKVKIVCPEHGVFEQLPYDHTSGHGCAKCISTISKLEIEINEFINNIGIDTITSSRSIVPPQQLDIYIPSKNIAIEFDGLYWHSEIYKDKDYHLNKTLACEEKGIKLIHIFEDEWIHKNDICKSRLKNLLGLTENKIYGRKCEIREVGSELSKVFLDKNHIQGNVNASIKIGLYHVDELVSLMSFNNQNNKYILVRFCNKLNTSVIGSADKLLKYFIKTYQPKEVISYADRRWSQGDLYEKLGFELINTNKPSYWYIIRDKRKHRFGFRKDVLIKKGFDKDKTEKQIMFERKIYRIYDCGTLTYKKSLY